MTLKATEQIRNNICYNNLPVILIGGYAGLSDSFDGASHQSITDIAIMRAMPNMKVLVPGDAYEMKQALELALKEKGSVYIRSSRNPSPTLFKDAPPMESGKIRRIKNGTDITIAVCGIPAYMAIEATETLEKEGVSVDLLNVSSIKPLDEETILDSVKKTGKILTIEEHNIIGGLGGAISELLCKEHPVYTENIGIEDVFAETGPYIDLLAKYGISEESIVHKARKLIQKS